MTANKKPKIAIIGAGLAGLCMAIQLKNAGIDNFTIFEKADEVGGTWRENTYPGVACDVPSHLYSFSFEPNPHWSSVFSPGAEIQAYAVHCADKYELRPHISFGTKLKAAKYDDGWHLIFENGHTEVFDFLINGIGGLHVPSFPEIEGMDSYKGAQFHTAQWQNDYDLEGKNVAVIGTAASALQIIPQIVNKVKSLTVFQRTPNWVMPREEISYSSKTKARFAKFNFLRLLHRLRIYLLFEVNFLVFKNNKIFQAAARRRVLKHLEEQVPDPELRAKLTPDYPIGCKRILASNIYFPALQKDNVTLVTDSIKRIDENSVVDGAGVQHDVDTVIYATGFKPFSILDSIEIVGKDGQQMADYFKGGGIRAHNAVSVPGFPNFALLVGPNSGLGHNSIILMMEAQVKYIVGCIQLMMKNGARSIDVKVEAADAFDAKTQHELKDTVWHADCHSWYIGDDGRIYTLWPGTTIRYRRLLSAIDQADFVFEK